MLASEWLALHRPLETHQNALGVPPLTYVCVCASVCVCLLVCDCPSIFHASSSACAAQPLTRRLLTSIFCECAHWKKNT